MGESWSSDIVDGLQAQVSRYEAEIESLRAALRSIHNCGQSAEPDHWKFRVMARNVSLAALKETSDAG